MGTLKASLDFVPRHFVWELREWYGSHDDDGGELYVSEVAAVQAMNKREEGKVGEWVALKRKDSDETEWTFAEKTPVRRLLRMKRVYTVSRIEVLT